MIISNNQMDRKQIQNTDRQKNSVFNSKLFINLDVDEMNYDDLKGNSSDNTEDSDNSLKFEETNYLSNDLKEKLECSDKIEIPNSLENKENNIINSNDNIINSLLSLAKNGYEFKPKNFRCSLTKKQPVFNPKPNIKISSINCVTQKNNLNFLNQIPNTNKHYINQEQKKNWICCFCKNLNYYFRTKCNRCKASIENSEKLKNSFVNFVV